MLFLFTDYVITKSFIELNICRFNNLAFCFDHLDVGKLDRQGSTHYATLKTYQKLFPINFRKYKNYEKFFEI